MEETKGRPDSTPARSRRVQPIASGPSGSSLTKREQEVLELIAFGIGNKEIAQRLGLGRRTVETHVDHVLRKLDVPTRARAVSEAIHLGLIGGSPVGDFKSTRARRPNNLPYQLTALVGREKDVEYLKTSLEANRLVTLSGTGGVGKTRIALRLGIDLLDAYADGVWLCNFSLISNPELVVNVVAGVLGAHERPNLSLTDSIARSLKRNRVLLIFDNCEHLVDALASLADEILHRCPSVRILATSRQPLGIMGEVIYRVPSLTVPDGSVRLNAENAMSFSATALFVERAHSSDPRFDLTNDNAQVVGEICRRLDGIPLAMELAATRVGVVNINRLAQSLDDRFNMLSAGNRAAVPRHKTLRTLIDWSYDLLSVQEQQLFRRASIFTGSFGYDAVMAVCGDDTEEVGRWDLLSSLTDKSLIVADTQGKAERYRLLESTRSYATEKLSIEERAYLLRRHAEFFCNEAVSIDRRWGTESTGASLARLEREFDNYRAALEWALGQGNAPELGGTLAGALWRFWYDGAFAVEGWYWISRAQSALDDLKQANVTSRLWLAKSLLCSGKAKHDCSQRALALFEALHDENGSAWALMYAAFGLFQMGRFAEAADLNDRALTLMRKCDDKYGIARALNYAAMLSEECPSLGSTRELAEQSLEAMKATRDEIGLANMLQNLAEMEFKEGHHERALGLVKDALKIQESTAVARILSLAYCNMGAYYIALGDLSRAREALRMGAPSVRGQDILSIAGVLQHFALLWALRGQIHKAARLRGYINLLFDQLDAQREFTEQWSNERLLATLRGQMSDSEIDDLRAEGAEWSEDRAFEEALT